MSKTLSAPSAGILYACVCVCVRVCVSHPPHFLLPSFPFTCKFYFILSSFPSLPSYHFLSPYLLSSLSSFPFCPSFLYPSRAFYKGQATYSVVPLWGIVLYNTSWQAFCTWYVNTEHTDRTCVLYVCTVHMCVFSWRFHLFFLLR